MKRSRVAVVIIATGLGFLFTSSLSLSAQGPQPVMAKDGKSAVYPVAADQVFVAAVRAAASKWTVTFSDKETGTVSFLTGTSYMNNRSLQVSVSVTRLAENETKVELATQKKVATWGLSFKADKGLMKDYFAALTAQLKNSPTVPK